jgi:hypothetical protein
VPLRYRLFPRRRCSLAADDGLIKPGLSVDNAWSFIALLATGQPPAQPAETMDRPARSAPGFRWGPCNWCIPMSTLMPLCLVTVLDFNIIRVCTEDLWDGCLSLEISATVAVV